MSKNVRNIILSFIILFMLPLGKALYAADFILGGDPEMECAITLRGTITEGDSERFSEFLTQNFEVLSRREDNLFFSFPTGMFLLGGNLCLDSSGGSFAEAIRIADMLVYNSNGSSSPPARMALSTLGTAVPEGAVCLSACAILFMAGGKFDSVQATENVREPTRFLHISAELGFHSPSLNLADGQYSEEEVQYAFLLAIETINQINLRRRVWYFSPSLLSRMMSTPPTSMYMIDTISKATSYGINLVGIPRIATPIHDLEQRACQNLLLHSSLMWRSRDLYRHPIPVEGGRGFYFLEPIGLRSRDGCRNETEFQFDPNSGTLNISEINNPPDHGAVFQEWAGIGSLNWTQILYPPYTTLEFIEALRRRYGNEVPNDVQMEPVIDHYLGACPDFLGAPVNAACRYNLTSVETAGGDQIEESWTLETHIGQELEIEVEFSDFYSEWQVCIIDRVAYSGRCTTVDRPQHESSNVALFSR